MKVELIYHADTGTVLSLLTRVAGVDDDGSVAALTGDALRLRGPGRTESIFIKSRLLRRFTVEADDQLDNLVINPWSFGVKDDALVGFGGAMEMEWDGSLHKFSVKFTLPPPEAHKVIFVVRREEGTELFHHFTASGFQAAVTVTDAKWALVLASGYRTVAMEAT